MKLSYETKLIKQSGVHKMDGALLTKQNTFGFEWKYEFFLNEHNDIVLYIRWRVDVENTFNQKAAYYTLETAYKIKKEKYFAQAPFEDFSNMLYQSFGQLQAGFGIAFQGFVNDILPETKFKHYDSQFLSFRDKFVKEKLPELLK